MPTQADRLLIELAVKNHLITKPEGDACLAELAQTPGLEAGAHLIAKNLIKDRHLESLRKKVEKMLGEAGTATQPAPPEVSAPRVNVAASSTDATFVAPDPATSPLASAEGSVVLFGQIAIKLGMLEAAAARHKMTTAALLEFALKKQEELAARGQAMRIGQLLVKASMLTNEQVVEVLRYQEKWIVSCTVCQKRYNVSGTVAKSSMGLACIACGGQLVQAGASGITVSQTHPGAGAQQLAPMPAPAAQAQARATARHEPTPDDPAGLVGVEWKGHQVDKVLGRGGMGAVYKATQVELRRPVALKVMLRAGAQAGAGERERFEREARLVGKLNHPNIVQIYNAEWNDDLCWFTMEFVKGQDFKALLRSGQSPIRKGAEIVAKVARAMDFAHRRNVIHRDLKPQNIMVVEETGEPKILDFGLAKSISKEQQEKLTQMGSFLGTPAYMAPEQAGGDPDAIDARADVYALGAILYEVLTGRPPFVGKKAIQVIKQVLKEDPVPCRQVFPQAPAELEAVALKALKKDPAERHQTAGELADEIEDVIGKVSRNLAPPASGEHPGVSTTGGGGTPGSGGDKKGGFFSRIFKTGGGS